MDGESYVYIYIIYIEYRVYMYINGQYYITIAIVYVH